MIEQDDDRKFCWCCGAPQDRLPDPPPPPHPSFDDITHEVIVGEERRHVPPIPWKMLAELRRRAPAHAPMNSLIRCLGQNSGPRVNVHLSGLRAMLAGTPVSIKNERGLGYRLVNADVTTIRLAKHQLMEATL